MQDAGQPLDHHSDALEGPPLPDNPFAVAPVSRARSTVASWHPTAWAWGRSAGARIAFQDRGEHDLKGVPGRWRLFAVMP